MKKIESLDLFRGVAGYGVAVCHYYTFLFNNLYIKAEFESKLRNYEGRDSNEIQIKTKYTF